MHAGLLAHALDRLATTARVLYVGAHPDDENTALLAYLTYCRHVTVAYLSMTRGGGGQNLIGAERDHLLDVLRTQEALAARRIDGAAQRFTRMRDFGYAKTPAQALQIWDRDAALADLVWVIRTFQPDVIITRFDEHSPDHGQHTASAMLVRDAYYEAADSRRYRDQLRDPVDPWRTSRLLYNLPPGHAEPPPLPGVTPPLPPITIDIGGYDPRLGLSYGELGAQARSRHKSQGFGSAAVYGPIVEGFIWLAGSRSPSDILGGIETSWARFGKQASPLIKALGKARDALQSGRPERVLPALLNAHRALANLRATGRRDVRLNDARQALDLIIATVAGVWTRATADQPGVVPGSSVTVRTEVVRRQTASVTLGRIGGPHHDPVEVNRPLALHESQHYEIPVPVPEPTPVSVPSWLVDPPLAGRYAVASQSLIGAPLDPPALSVAVELDVGHRVVCLDTPVVHAWVDPVQGERTSPVLVVPPATVTPLRRAVLFPNGHANTVVLRVRAWQDEVRGTVRLGLPVGWGADPERLPVSFNHAGDELTVHFAVTPPHDAAATEIRPEFERDGSTWSYREDVVDYPHITRQVVLQPARVHLEALALEVPYGLIGYVEGPGDSVAADLAHVGLRVELLGDNELRTGDLSRYAAIVTGVRAYNTRPVLHSVHDRLMRYVENRGVLVAQYSASDRPPRFTGPIGPYPLTIGPDRICDPTAPLVPLDPDHPVLLVPNPLLPEDYAGWVQERGLYLAQSWDPAHDAIYLVADPGESPRRGILLVAPYGRGRFVYTAMSFFRQLPAGVPGAYRLFANLLTLEEL